MWNWTDLFITIISALELTVTIFAHVMPEAMGGSEEQASSAAQSIVLLRVLRVVRVVRMVKLVRSPMLSDLANMMVGFIIGLPSLGWVLVLFIFILYMVGLCFRLAFGPTAGQDLSHCVEGDAITDYHDPSCPVHWIYGEEFFGTVSLSMFTAFRFMLGDYSTRGGKSIVVAFSQGYGAPFDTVFVAWMIVVIFGLFNIITAIFVDTTIAGLKYNDVKRKFAKQYERRYVINKLGAILDRLRKLHMEIDKARSMRKSISIKEPWLKTWDTQKIAFDIDEFAMVMEDEEVKQLLQDMDIDMTNPTGAFDTFDADGAGTVTVQEMCQAIIKLRGEPEKKDLIAGWVAIKSLHDKVDHFTNLVIGPDVAPTSPR
jgi:hypothetical protein